MEEGAKKRGKEVANPERGGSKEMECSRRKKKTGRGEFVALMKR